MKVLLIYDQACISSYFSRILKREKVAVYITGDVKRAFDVMRRHLPNLVIMDCKVGNEDAFEVYQRIKSDAIIKSIAFIIVSDLPVYVDERNRAKALGITAYFRMPLSASDLLKHCNK